MLRAVRLREAPVRLQKRGASCAPWLLSSSVSLPAAELSWHLSHFMACHVPLLVDKQQEFRWRCLWASRKDDGGDSDWVAGVALGTNARVRLVAPEGIELQ